MKVNYLLLASLVTMLFSCHKNASDPPGPPPTPPPAVVKLKDLNERNLPAPYYHFEYDDSGYMTAASVSAELLSYRIIYTGGKHILRMESKSGGNQDTLLYEYANGDPAVTRIVNGSGTLYRRVHLTYSPTHQLQQVEWEVKSGTADLVPEQSQLFSYYPDGNVKELVYHLFAVGPQIDTTYTDRFENYDNKVNTEGFSLLHPYQQQHLILLPGHPLQLNNPRRVIRTGYGINYTVDYTYTYDSADRPLVKTGDLTFTNGSSNGQHFQLQTTYSYY